MSHPPRGRIGRVLAPSVQPGRLILALKTALAAGIAWPVGRLLPDVDEFSYYAPLGALIVMMPTLMGSLRSTVQMVLGLILGVLLAWAVIISPLPGAVSVAIAVGLGVLLGGLGGLGVGRDYVPIAALFVLVVGGADAEDFSAGYLLQMGLGMAVGVVVNATIMPPLWLRESSASIADRRQRLADLLDDAAGRVHRRDDLEPSIREVSDLHLSLREAEALAADAAESRRLNPRARRHPYDMEEDFADIVALGRLSTHLMNVIEDVQAATARDATAGATDSGNDAVADSLEELLRRLAALVRAWDARGAADDAVTEARAAVERLAVIERAHADRAVGGGDPVISPEARRMVTLVEARLRAG